MERRKINPSELNGLPIEEGKIKVIVLDGRNGNSMIAVCPEHGDVVTHIHNGRFEKFNLVDEFKVNK